MSKMFALLEVEKMEERGDSVLLRVRNGYGDPELRVSKDTAMLYEVGDGPNPCPACASRLALPLENGQGLCSCGYKYTAYQNVSRAW